MGSGKRSDYFREEEDDRPPSFAQIPTSFGQELRACLRCRLVKTYDQVLFRVPSRAQTLYACLTNAFISVGFYCTEVDSFTLIQFRESGCENCPFLEMEKEHDNVVNCTTPNFTG